MTWTLERRRAAAIEAPLRLVDGRLDSVVIERPGWYQVVTPSAPGYLNEVAFSQIADSDCDRVIDDVIATYHGMGQRAKWCVGPWTKPDDFGGRLVRRGFVGWDVRGMGIDTSASIGEPSDVEIVDVDASMLTTFNEVSLRGWETSADQLAGENERLGRALASEPRSLHLFLARRHGEVVGTAGYVLRGDYAYLYATQVLAHARGGGVYKALVAGRLRRLRAHGIAYAVTHAREATSAPILERIGFETLFRSKCFVLEPPA